MELLDKAGTVKEMLEIEMNLPASGEKSNPGKHG